VRPRVQVPLHGTYQVHAPPQACRDILRVMSIQKKSENEDRENKKRKAEKVVAQKAALKRNVVVVHVVVQGKKMRRMAGPEIVSPIRAVQQLREQRGYLISEFMLSMELYNSVQYRYRTVEYVIKKQIFRTQILSNVHVHVIKFGETCQNVRMYVCL
jgi:hypothetical protein